MMVSSLVLLSFNFSKTDVGLL